MPSAQRRGYKPVYPRWRGELKSLLLERGYGNGLSPLARGTRIPGWNGGALARFIPAGAGNSEHHQALCSKAPVYPRWRGELSPISVMERTRAGLSPLARGTQLSAAE